MPKYKMKYIYENPHGSPYHTWTAVGAKGGIHVYVVDNGEGARGGRYSGAHEAHYRSPPPSMADDAPDHEECWLLKCPCWHDGGSEYVPKHWIPNWLSDRHDHERMFKMLAVEMDRLLAAAR